MIGRYRITDQLLDEFRRRLVTEEKSELTIAQYMRDVRDFCGFLQKGEPVDKEEAIAYKDHLVKTYRSSATVNTKLAALNKFFAATGMDGCRVKLLRRQRPDVLRNGQGADPARNTCGCSRRRKKATSRASP